MQRAFPFPINIGTDICRVSRISRILTKHQAKYAHRFIKRIFTPQEQVWYRSRLLPLIEYVHFVEHREPIQAKVEIRRRKNARSIEALTGLVGPKEIPLPYDYHTAAKVKPIDSSICSPYGTQDPKLTKRETKSIPRQLQENMDRVARFIAGRFAAKEAAKKAFSKRRLGFHDITIDNPVLDNLRSRAPITTIKPTHGQEDQIVPMSISHDGKYATAVCISCEDVAPPLVPDLQEIEPMLARLLDETSIRRLALLDAPTISYEASHGRVPSAPPVDDHTPKKSEERLSTSLPKIPVKLATPIMGRLSEILSSTLSGRSNVPRAEIDSDINVAETSNSVQSEISSNPINDLNVSKALNSVQSVPPSSSVDNPKFRHQMTDSPIQSGGSPERSLSSPDNPKVRYHAYDALSSEIPISSSDNSRIKYAGFHRSVRPESNPSPDGSRITSKLTSDLIDSNYEGWINYANPESGYIKQLVTYSNYNGLPLKIDPELKEAKKARIEKRKTELETRSESIYGLPTYIDPKIVKKNLENSLFIKDIPLGVTLEELMEVFREHCSSMKLCLKVRRSGSSPKLSAWAILGRKGEARKLINDAKKHPERSPVVRGIAPRICATDNFVRELLRTYGTGVRKWDWRAEFWTTDLFHPYNKEECEQHIQEVGKMWKQKIAEREEAMRKRDERNAKKEAMRLAKQQRKKREIATKSLAGSKKNAKS